MEISTTVRLFTLPDGRTISYAIYGDPNSSRTIFYHHGYPSSHEEALSCHDAAAQHSIRLISADRPGFGSSTFQPARKLLDWPADLLALADHLKVDRFAVLGVSGGAPYVLACWHRMPRSRCVGLGTLCGLFPTNLGLSGMLVMTRVLFWTASWSPWLAGTVLDLAVGSTARSAKKEELERKVDGSFGSRPRADRDAWNRGTHHVREALTGGTRGAFENGPKGAGWEAQIYASDWGFTLEELETEPGKVIFWHGDQDVNVPLAMAQKASKLLRNSELRVVTGQAHLSLVVDKADEAIHTLGRLIDEA